jgi:dTDP-4-amino-4,6-dideoxygalactose transaminase
MEVLRGKWLTMGEQVESFESEFAAYLGVQHAVAVANGTAALHLAFQALGIGPGAEIVQPAINFVASANMTVACGAAPVFADIHALCEPTLDPEEVRRRITPRTRAVVVMHYGGYLCRMVEIREICRARGVPLIEDACHAVGARLADGGKAGSLGDIGCFSFFSNKNLAVGEGGMVTTHSDELAQKVRRLRSHGMTTLTWDRHRGHAHSYNVDAHGYNYRLDEIRAALGRVQLRKLDANNARRAALTLIYRHNLEGLPGWIVPFGRHDLGSAYHLMVAVARDEQARAGTLEALRASRIQTSLHYPCIPDFSAFAAYRSEGLEKSREFTRRAITLPLYPTMSPAQVEEVCAVIQKHDDADFHGWHGSQTAKICEDPRPTLFMK